MGSKEEGIFERWWEEVGDVKGQIKEEGIPESEMFYKGRTCPAYGTC